MRLGPLTGWPGRAVLLLVVGAVGGAAAVAIAAVPGSDGVIHACYEVQQDGTTPVAGAPNVRIIDPSAGQTCDAPGAPGPPEHALSWNVTGPPGPQGAGGPAGRTASIGGQTFTLGDGKTLTGAASPIPPLQAKPGGVPVGTMTLGRGGGATSSDVLAWQLVGAPGAASRGIQIVKRVDKASPSLFKACVNGKHIPVVVITLRRKVADGGPQTITLTNARVDSYGTDKGTDKGKGGDGTVTESISLTFESIKIEYR